MQVVKSASVAQLESWLEDSKKKNRPIIRLQYYLLNKYCDAGVSIALMFSRKICICNGIGAIFAFSDRRFSL